MVSIMVQSTLPHITNKSPLFKQIYKAIETEDYSKFYKYIAKLHPADIADILEVSPLESRGKAFWELPEAIQTDVLLELESAVRTQLISEFDSEVVADLVRKLNSSEALYIIEELEFELQSDVISHFSERKQRLISESLSYDEDSAARIMERELIEVPKFWTVGQVKSHIKSVKSKPDMIFNVYVIDAFHHPQGYISLDKLLQHQDTEKVADLMEPNRVSFSPETKQKEVAFNFRHYGLAAAPVVDENNVLKGNINLNQIVNVIDAEAERSFLGLAGVTEVNTHLPLLTAALDRFKWVTVTAISSILSSLTIALFDATIEKVVALAVLMSIVVAINGSISLQVASLTIRALANEEFRLISFSKTLLKECQIGLLNGFLVSVLLFFITWVWYASIPLAAVFCISIVMNAVVSSLFGMLIPYFLNKFGYDPAISAPPFLIPACDMMGYGSFLYIATKTLL